MKFGRVKDRGLAYKFYLNDFFLTKLLNMAMVQSFEVLLEQKLNCVQISVIYTVSYLIKLFNFLSVRLRLPL
jgi:hypothetical protein